MKLNSLYMPLINKFLFLYGFIYSQFISNKFSNKNDIVISNGVYFINSVINNNYLQIINNHLILSNKTLEFQFIHFDLNIYIILYRSLNKTLGIDINNKIILYNQIDILNLKKIFWNLIKINNN